MVTEQKQTMQKQDMEKQELKVGSRLILTLTDNETGKVVLKEEHEVVEVPRRKGGDVEALANSAESGMRTRQISQEWFDPEIEALNAEVEAEAPALSAGLDPKIAVDAAKLGLDIAKFAWEVIKDNKAVVDTTATTSSVLYKGTNGLEYEGAREGSASSYTLTVRDSLIKSWKLIQAEIRCEGTYHATPSKKGIPNGYYMPAVNLYAKKAHADFPCQLSAKAKLSEVSNLGRGSVDPMVTILASLDYGWAIQRKHLTLKFSARGSQGFRRAS